MRTHPRLTTFACALLVSRLAAAASGGLPMTLSHSGFLLDAGDDPVSNPALAVTFRIFDRSAAVAGDVLEWEATCPVVVHEGHYTALLGEPGCAGVEPLDSADLPADVPRWLEVAIGAVTLSPRLVLSPVATAALAGVAATADTLGGLAPSAYATAAHAHSAAAIGDFDTATLAAALASGAFAPVSHGHPTAGPGQAGLISPADWTSFAARIGTENDPKVGAQSPGGWCLADGTSVTCTSPSPGGTVGLSAGSYANATVVVDAEGRISAISAGPAPFSFANVATAALGTVVTSEIVGISGLSAPAPVTVSGATWRACTDASCSTAPAFTSAAGSVPAGGFVQLRLTSPASEVTTATAYLTVGGFIATWNVSTGDFTPAAFAFVNRTNVARSAVITSAPVTVGAFDGPLTATASGGASVSLDGTTWSTSVTGVTSGAALRVRIISASGFGGAVTATVTLGAVTSSVWTVTVAPSAIVCAGPGVTQSANRCTFPFAGAEQTLLAADFSGTLNLYGWGAGGGGGNSGGSSSGGGGAGAVASFAVASGDAFSVFTGGGGTYNVTNGAGGGGGGATWVTKNGAPWIVLGGGGGGGHHAFTYGLGVPASSGTSGTADRSNSGGTTAGVGGTGGAGGGAAVFYACGGGGGGGGGLNSAGATTAGQSGVTQTSTGGGAGPGGAGGTISSSDGATIVGGLGGYGGGGAAGYGGGGGGGYSGGGGGANCQVAYSGGGGGGSFAAAGSISGGSGANPGNFNGTNYVGGVGVGGAPQTAGGNGLVVVTW